MTIHIIPILTDNYTYLIEQDGKAMVVDPGEAAPVIRYLELNALTLTHILCTHHHGDHVGGVMELKTRTNAAVIGPAKQRIEGVDILVKHGDRVEGFEVIETPGHTLGHVCYYAPGILFSGDTLFSMGCGRLFEGTPADMWNSLQKLKALPDDTLIYCGHEYTQSNGRFCLSVEPENIALIQRMSQVAELRSSGKPTLPVTLNTEKSTNVFLRAGSVERFAELRHMKDLF